MGRPISNSLRKQYPAEAAIWSGMKFRCFNPTVRGYKNYGGRGITVCDEWARSFAAFFRDMGPRPPGCSIDRINVNGNYEPGNCRWATATEQGKNRRNNRFVRVDGVEMLIGEAASKFGLNKYTVYDRIASGWPECRWFEKPMSRAEACAVANSFRHGGKAS